MFICLTYKHDHYIWCPDRCYVLVMPLEGRARETKRVEEEKRLKKSSAHQALCDEIGALEQRLSTLRVVTYSSCTSKSGPVVCVVKLVCIFADRTETITDGEAVDSD